MSSAGQALVAGPHEIAFEMASSSARVWDVGYPAMKEFDTHRHPTAVLCLVTRGGYTEWRPRRREVGTGRMAVYAVGSEHAVRTGAEGLRLLHVTDPDGRGWRDPPGRRTAGILRQIAREAEVHAEEGDDAGTLHLESLCHELRGRPWRAGGRERAPPWMRRIVRRLRDDFASSLTLSELAEAEGVHPSHLSRAFRARLGMTPGEYLRRVRVANAVARIAEGQGRLSGIALATGFCDQSHMCRWFRRYLGVSPGAVRAPSTDASGS